VEADDLRSQAQPVDEAGERLIADRLDALEAERVIQRALELEAESLDDPRQITAEQLERIAAEIGVDSTFLQQALSEVRLEPEKRGRFATWVLPDALFETATVGGVSRQELDTAINKWMTQREGMTPGARLSDGIRWHLDRRWSAKTRAKTLSGGNRISRVAAGDVRHQVQSVSANEHAVALSSDGRVPLLIAKLIIAAAAVPSALLILGTIISGGILIGLGVSAVMMAAAALVGVGVARWWARGIRGALSRALVGITDRANTGGTIMNRLRRRKVQPPPPPPL